MKLKLVVASIGMGVVLLTGCGGGGAGDTSQGDAHTPQLKISENNKEKVYSTAIAAIDDFPNGLHLDTFINSFDEDGHNCESGSVEIEKEDENTSKFIVDNCVINANTYDGSFVLNSKKVTYNDENSFYFLWTISFVDGGATVKTTDLTTSITSGTLIIKVHDFGELDEMEEMKNIFATRSDNKNNAIFISDFSFSTSGLYKTEMSGWVSSTFIDKQWFQVATHDFYIDTDDNTDRGYILLTGKDSTTMKILLDKENVDIFINGENVDHYTDYDLFDRAYDRRNEYFGIDEENKNKILGTWDEYRDNIGPCINDEVRGDSFQYTFIISTESINVDNKKFSELDCLEDDLTKYETTTFSYIVGEETQGSQNEDAYEFDVTMTGWTLHTGTSDGHELDNMGKSAYGMFRVEGDKFFMTKMDDRSTRETRENVFLTTSYLKKR